MIRVFTSKNQEMGQKGENEAAEFLKKHGFSILDRNVANKFGEIDIITKKKGIVHFFEVKAGYMGGWLNPAENLTKVKLRKFLISVEHYVLVHTIKDYRVKGIIVLFDRNGGVKVEMIELF